MSIHDKEGDTPEDTTEDDNKRSGINLPPPSSAALTKEVGDAIFRL